jgi:hypothetical protein
MEEYLNFGRIQRTQRSTRTVVHIQGTMAMKEAITKVNLSRSFRRVNKNIRP